ncbi:MAG: transcription antitermination factor NusB [Acidobacteriaceae bacterium]
MAGRISPARKTAFDLLLELRRKPDLHSDHLLRSKPVEALSDLDKNLATTLVMGVLRWQLVLQQRIRDALTKSRSHLADPVQVSLELGALQLLLLDRIPARAAIFESVELVRQSGNGYAVGLVNAVLRKLAQTPKLGPADAIAAHPPWMVDRWIAAFGLDTATAICRADQLPPAEDERGVLVVRARNRVQDEGSQLIAELAGRGTEILDCCAAPGGKTAILAERNPTASIIACDISPARLKTMQALLGPRPNILFRVVDATRLPFQNQFDLVLCDAPCSGTGTLARNPEIKHRITPEDLQRHHDRQLRLLVSAMRALREGGRLIYSTCSLEPEENESVVAEALKQEKGFQLLPWREQIKTLESEGILHSGTADRLFPNHVSDHYLRTFPGLYHGDGFFAASLIISQP